MPIFNILRQRNRILRTWCAALLFAGDLGIASLHRVLNSYALHNPQVGYCQVLPAPPPPLTDPPALPAPAPRGPPSRGVPSPPPHPPTRGTRRCPPPAPSPLSISMPTASWRARRRGGSFCFSCPYLFMVLACPPARRAQAMNFIAGILLIMDLNEEVGRFTVARSPLRVDRAAVAFSTVACARRSCPPKTGRGLAVGGGRGHTCKGAAETTRATATRIIRGGDRRHTARRDDSESGPSHRLARLGRDCDSDESVTRTRVSDADESVTRTSDSDEGGSDSDENVTRMVGMTRMRYVRLGR